MGERKGLNEEGVGWGKNLSEPPGKGIIIVQNWKGKKVYFPMVGDNSVDCVVGVLPEGVH